MIEASRESLVKPSVTRSITPGVPLWLLAMSILPIAFLITPLAALIQRTLAVGRWQEALSNPIVGNALILSLTTTAASLLLIILLGTPVSYLMARYRFLGWRMLDAAIDLPMVLPPAVAGLALLMLFGRTSPLGALLSSFGFDVAFSSVAVVLAQTFVAAPFYIRSARAGFESVDPMLERVAATLGETDFRIFCRISVPLAFPSLLGGAVMSWARALGEFGATIMFAGNSAGRTQTMPLAIYTAWESDLWVAMMIAVLLVVLCFAALAIFKMAVHGWTGKTHAT